LLAWTAGLRTRVDTWGPPPLNRMTRLFFEMNKYDIDVRTSNEGRIPLAPLVHVHDLRTAGEVMRDDACASVEQISMVVHHNGDARTRALRIRQRCSCAQHNNLNAGRLGYGVFPGHSGQESACRECNCER
jgi:hypothetical protein